jgi:Mlc titration factor MtfA (ptsG expression regulator)
MWARVLSDEFQQLRRAAEDGRETVLDTYGAQNPAEFFAVATECFFEKPGRLKERHPALYAELQEFYRQDPLLYAPARPETNETST